MFWKKIWKLFVRSEEECVHKDTPQQAEEQVARWQLEIDNNQPINNAIAQYLANSDAQIWSSARSIEDEEDSKKECAEFYAKHGRHPNNEEFFNIIANQPFVMHTSNLKIGSLEKL